MNNYPKVIEEILVKLTPDWLLPMSFMMGGPPDATQLGEIQCARENSVCQGKFCCVVAVVGTIASHRARYKHTFILHTKCCRLLDFLTYFALPYLSPRPCIITYTSTSTSVLYCLLRAVWCVLLAPMTDYGLLQTGGMGYGMQGERPIGGWVMTPFFANNGSSLRCQLPILTNQYFYFQQCVGSTYSYDVPTYILYIYCINIVVCRAEGICPVVLLLCVNSTQLIVVVNTYMHTKMTTRTDEKNTLHITTTHTLESSTCNQ